MNDPRDPGDPGDPEALRLRRRLAQMALAGIIATFVGTASLDAGYHGDEWYHVHSMQMTVERLALTQDEQHIYNGLYFMPGYAVLAWHALPELPGIVGEILADTTVAWDEHRYPQLQRWKTDMVRLLSTNAYKSQVRFVFVLLTALALPWVFLTVLRLYPHRYLAAVGATAFVGLSWEVSQRARSIEVDAVQMMGVALELYFVSCALTLKSRPRGLGVAMGLGAAAGLSVAAKASGVYAVLPAFAAVAIMPLWRGARDRLALMATVVASMLVTTSVASPTTILDPLRSFYRPLALVVDYASVSPAQPPYVDGPAEHLFRVGQWLFLAVPSASIALSVVSSAVVLLGWWSLSRRRRRFALVAAVYPLVILGTLSQLNLLQLRNNTQLIPFLALGFGAGLAWLGDASANKGWARHALRGGLVASLVFNAAWLVVAQKSVTNTTAESILAEVRDYLDEADYAVYLSPRLRGNLRGWVDERYLCAPGEPPPGNFRVVMYYNDHHPWRWKMYRMGFVERTFAPLDNNYDWYSTAKGRLEHHRVVSMDPDNAEEMGVDMDDFVSCTQR